MSEDPFTALTNLEDATKELRKHLEEKSKSEINEKLDNIMENIEQLKVIISRIASTIAVISTKNDQILNILSAKKIPAVSEKQEESPVIPEIIEPTPEISETPKEEENKEPAEASDISPEEQAKLENELENLKAHQEKLQERLNELYELSVTDPTYASEYEQEIEEKEASLKKIKKNIRDIKRKLGRL